MFLWPSFFRLFKKTKISRIAQASVPWLSFPHWSYFNLSVNPKGWPLSSFLKLQVDTITWLSHLPPILKFVWCITRHLVSWIVVDILLQQRSNHESQGMQQGDSLCPFWFIEMCHALIDRSLKNQPNFVLNNVPFFFF